MNNQYDNDIDDYQTKEYYDHLQEQEVVKIGEIRAMVQQETNRMETDDSNANQMPIAHYGMGILWQAAIDSTLQKDLSALALKMFLELVIDRYSMEFRIDYLALALSQILQKKAVVQSAQVVKDLVITINRDQSFRYNYDRNAVTVVGSAENQLNLVDHLVDGLESYFDVVL